ncbi:hypothetical protein [Propionicicella superfundia]|uniref:hypothetical protein n=1 Tax=Propionicicella superfundia TaxID=348582 RepID=UPI0004054A8A|nr:hypothetical protein [Propionicicella superfundia]
MKGEPSIWFVVTADQRRSRRSADAVPAALDRLSRIPGLRLAFERTAGDEIQGLTARPDAVVAIVRELTRLRSWRVGIGVGPVESPLPASTRQARGPAYVAARTAVERTRSTPTGLALEADRDSVAAGPYSDANGTAQRAETALWLLRSVLSRRTQEGWDVADLLATGMTNQRAAAHLGISPSAASQRAGAAGVAVATAGEALAAGLLEDLGAGR